MKKILSIVAIAFAFCLVNTSYSYARSYVTDAARAELEKEKIRKKQQKSLKEL